MKKSILFLCVGNSCRSQMAEAIARHHFGEWFDAASAGSLPTPIHENTFKVIQELGIKTDGLHPKHVDEFRNRSFDYVIPLCQEAEGCPIPPQHSQLIQAVMPDPTKLVGSPEQILNSFRRVRDQIQRKIFEIFHDILFRDGIEHWNTKHFWNAHESWEGIWRTTEDSGIREFFQGIIQLAAALHHFYQGNLDGALAMLQKSESHLKNAPSEHGGIKAKNLWRGTHDYIERPGQIDRPKLLSS